MTELPHMHCLPKPKDPSHTSITVALISAATAMLTCAVTLCVTRAGPASTVLHDAQSQARDYKAKLEDELEKKSKLSVRKISYEVAMLDEKIKDAEKLNRQPTVDLLGMNALGPIHQGHKQLLACLMNGGRVRVILLDPDSASFRAQLAIEKDNVGLNLAELNAALAGWRNVLEELKAAHPEYVDHLEIRFRGDLANGAPNLPDRSLWIINQNIEGAALAIVNPYPRKEAKEDGKPGTEGQSYTWANNTTDKPYYDEEVNYFNDLWKVSQRISLTSDRQAIHLPYVKVRGELPQVAQVDSVFRYVNGIWMP